MHRRRRDRNHQKNKLMLFSAMGLLAFMTIGYAAFNTQLNIHVKGNILDSTISPSELKNQTVTTGDGLYADASEDGRYIYRGAQPNNYITFNNETWRIISVENDNTLKIIKDTGIGTYPWDESGTRNSSTSAYCTYGADSGCNAWAATANLIGSPNIFTLHYPTGNPSIDTQTVSGSVVTNASLNTYLNTDYYNSLAKISSDHIVEHSFNVGTPGYDENDTDSITMNVQQEALYKWNGKVGLMNVTEYMRTTTSTTCTNLQTVFAEPSACSGNNWLFKQLDEWTMSPEVTEGRMMVFTIYYRGDIFSDWASEEYEVRPVVYLSSSVKLSGNGTSGNHYKIQ